MSAPQPPGTPAAWYPDPSGRHDHRWFNGSSWTADVADGGNRGFDPLVGPFASSARPLASPSSPEGSRPGRAAALTSLTLGALSMAIAWMPFVVVLGIAAALSAIVLGIIAAHRATQGTQAGIRHAVAGIVCGTFGLLLSGVGLGSSRELLDDMERVRDPGTHSVVVVSCAVDVDGRAVATGRLTNRDSRARSYAVIVSFGDGEQPFADTTVDLMALAPGDTEDFETSTSAGGTPAAELTCEVAGVEALSPTGR